MQIRSSFVVLTAIISLAGCGSSKHAATVTTPPQPVEPAPLAYTVNLNDRSDDTFKVTLDVDDLGPDNAVYQFASTAPGTYQVMDIGRFVRSFTALDENGDPIQTEHVTTNQWKISKPERVAAIRYTIAETWDTPVEEHPVYMMAGTSIEDDNVLINGQAVFGYPTGMQNRPIKIHLEYPIEWKVGTALRRNPDGDFEADDYDLVVDSPILLGRLSRASMDVRGSAIDVFTYSKTDKVQSKQILDSIRDILNSAADFLGQLPIDRYAFLFHFEDVSMGAWEHSYSSEYVFSESNFNDEATAGIASIVAHEFFHIVTPLNIHSEIVQDFNFVQPVASEHLWLYEGTTEWASDIMQLRAGLITLDGFLGRMTGKLKNNDRFDKSYSLSKLSLTSYTDAGQRQYGNIYERGALVAGLLDIRLLELSHGERGLRELLLDLSKRYGPDKAFDEATFFDTVTAMTYPEIRMFFDRYVRDTQPLPVKEYYGKLGIDYEPETATGEQVPTLDLQLSVSGTQFVIAQASEIVQSCGMQTNDIVTAVDGTEVTLQNAQQAFGKLRELGANEPFTFTLQRGEQSLDVTCAKKMVEKIDRHVFSLNPNATPARLALRKMWMRNQ